MNADRAQLAALDADGMHNTQRMVWEYGEFDTVKDHDHPREKIDGLGFYFGKNTPAHCAYKYDTLNDAYWCLTCSTKQRVDQWTETGGACSKSPSIENEELRAELTRVYGAYKAATVKERSIIQARSETHGDFTINSHVSQAIKRAVRSHGEFDLLEDYQRESIDAIAGKIGRIVAGDASFDDHWQDIAGYAELVRERLKK